MEETKQRYEYDAEEVAFGEVTATQRIGEHLNERAREGWRLIGINRATCHVPYAGEPPVAYEILWERPL